MSKELRGHPLWFSTEHLSTRQKLEEAYPAGKDVEAWVEELEALSEEELEKLFGQNSFDVSRALESYAVLKLFSQR